MADGNEKQRRKIVRDQLRQAEKRKAEARLPAPKDQLSKLLEWVDDHLEGGCDHTLSKTLEFISANGLDEAPTVQWLNEYGGFCDCEVVANVLDNCPAFH